MKITHIGAKNCVTGSCHLIQAAEVNLLVDCGIAQGHDPVLPFDQWPVPPAAVDYLFLTHAHIDHTGRVPDLIDAGFAGEIICTHATKALKAAGDHPIRFKHLYAVERFKDHRRLLDLTGPAIIIAGSGMCTGGRIVNHLKHGLDDPKNDLFFVGYQAAGTPGRAILEGRTPSKADIHGLTGYSAHADQQTLAAWVAAMPEPPGEIRLVHGEPKAQTALTKRLNT